MTNVDSGTCEQFIAELRRSNLVEPAELERHLEQFFRRHPGGDARVLAEQLVAQRVLTPFQAERVASGQAQGLVLGPYVLTESIGSGSMGFVYKAASKNDRKTYAVKVLPRRSMWNVRLARRQVRVFGQFEHPAVVPFVDVGTAGGLHYLVWEYVEGETLESAVQQLGRLDAPTVAQVGQQIAAGLNAAQANGLFHGLLKPSNIMICAGGRVGILDFGIGSLLAENEGESLVDTMSTANALSSGLNCCSPESIREPADRTPAGDQYSLGCVLYYCLTGRYPFDDGNAVEKMMAHQFKQPTPVAELAPGTPAELGVLIDRLMQKRPEDRYPSFEAVAAELNALAAAPQAASPPPAPAHRKSGDASENRATPPAAATPPQPGPAARLTPALNPALLPASRRGERLPGSKAVTLSPPARPKPMVGPPAALKVPTRRELLGEEEPPTVVQRPRRAAESPAPAPPSSARLPAQAPAATVAPWGPERRPMMGPVTFIALASAVGVSCYLIANYLLH